MKSRSEGPYNEVRGGFRSASRMRIVLFSESYKELTCEREVEGKYCRSYPAKLVVVVPDIEQKFEHFLITLRRSPRQ